jgi:hypothetical protein
MNRFYSNGDLVLDLDAVYCVSFNSVVVGGVQLKISEAVAFDLRKQFRAYKNDRDKKSEALKVSVAKSFFEIERFANFLGVRIARRDAGKKINSREVIENAVING